MGRQAAGAYLRVLREARGLTQQEVATQIGLTNYQQIYRIETGSHDTSATTLLAFGRAVGGQAEDIERLMLEPKATVMDGIMQAQARLAPQPDTSKRQQALDYLDSLTPEDVLDLVSEYHARQRHSGGVARRLTPAWLRKRRG